jgi:hypothetical protein
MSQQLAEISNAISIVKVTGDRGTSIINMLGQIERTHKWILVTLQKLLETPIETRQQLRRQLRQNARRRRDW